MVPPDAIHKQIHATFFGTNEYEVHITDEETRELMGLNKNRKQKQGRKTLNEMAHGLYERCEVDKNQMNARQAFLKAEGGTPKYEIPQIKR